MSPPRTWGPHRHPDNVPKPKGPQNHPVSPQRGSQGPQLSPHLVPNQRDPNTPPPQSVTPEGKTVSPVPPRPRPQAEGTPVSPLPCPQTQGTPQSPQGRGQVPGSAEGTSPSRGDTDIPPPVSPSPPPAHRDTWGHVTRPKPTGGHPKCPCVPLGMGTGPCVTSGPHTERTPPHVTPERVPKSRGPPGEGTGSLACPQAARTPGHPEARGQGPQHCLEHVTKLRGHPCHTGAGDSATKRVPKPRASLIPRQGTGQCPQVCPQRVPRPRAAPCPRRGRGQCPQESPVCVPKPRAAPRSC